MKVSFIVRKIENNWHSASDKKQASISGVEFSSKLPSATSGTHPILSEITAEEVILEKNEYKMGDDINGFN